MPNTPSPQALKPLLSANNASSIFEKPEPLSFKTRRRRHACLEPRVYMPIMIVLVQSMIFLGGWTFYLAAHRRPIPLPDSLAVLGKGAPQWMTFVVTLLSTLISITTAFFYSHAIRYSVAMSLSRPMSLFAIAAGMTMAHKRPILSFLRLKWTIPALICVAALSAQTAGWTTLLLPRKIHIEAPLTGFGVDLSNRNFIRKLNADYSVLNVVPDILINVQPVKVDSGVAAVAAAYNQTAIFNFNEMTFYRSTGGILLLNLEEMISQVGMQINSMLPANAHIASSVRSPPGFQTNYTAIQQGFTADVTCERRELNETTVPSLTVQSKSLFIGGTQVLSTRVLYDCRDGQKFYDDWLTQAASPPYNHISNVIFAELCELNNRTEYDLILVGYGNYNWIPTTVCTIRPKVTRVEVLYTETAFSPSNKPNFIEVGKPIDIWDIPAAGHVPTRMLLNTFTSRPFQGSSAGDALSSFWYSEQIDTDDPELLSNILVWTVIIAAIHVIFTMLQEAFIKGVMEFGGTLVRAAYTENTNTLYGGKPRPIPEEYRYDITGNYITETLGWHHVSKAVPAVLLAPSFITALSILLTLFIAVRSGKTPRIEGQDHFDLGNVLHIIAASSVGGFKEPFPSFEADDDEHIEHSQRVKIRFGYGESGALGLVQHSVV